MRSFISRLSELYNHAFAHRNPGEQRYRILNVTRNTNVAELADLADTGARRRRGLLGRSGLFAGEGLWIVPCEAVHTFGMKFAIDLVYLDRQSRVVKTRAAVPPGRVSACITAHSVVELPPGAIQNSCTERGDTLLFDAVVLNSSPAR